MQLIDLTAHYEPEPDNDPEPRVRAPLPPEFDECCYPIGEPRMPGFRYCTAPVAQRGAPYCLEHKRLCHMGRDISA